MQIILFDNQFRKKLFPLTATKAIAGLRCGILTIKERWERKVQQEVLIKTESYLQPLYKSIEEEDSIWIDASIIADDELVNKILSLQPNQSIADDKGLIAARGVELLASYQNSVVVETVKRLEYTWQLFQWNDEMIKQDFALIIKNRTSQKISSTNSVINEENIFIEQGAVVEHSILNANTGPIYIAKSATIMEGCLIRGSFALGENSLLKMGTKIYGATTLGNNCVGGGEIKNSILSAYSNKAHDGYLGDSVIGEWCNMGAGTSNSNIKNTGGEIKLWNEYENGFVDAGQKCGVIMGDYSRTAINSSINTGSIIGVCCNVFGEGLLFKVIKNFSWGIEGEYEFEKALRDINNWKQMKNKFVTEEEKKMIQHIFENR
jgi:UDP-N-acetylglucosamine diphosphorylase/glucosamine-1-phosphate N-acetyltransferase